MEQPTEDKGVRLVWEGSTCGDGSTRISEVDLEAVLRMSLWIDSNGYVRCSGSSGYRYLHNFILQHSDPAYPIDHINNDKTDNRRCNLRILPRTDNTLRPQRVDDAEEARILQDYAEGRLLRSQVHEALRRIRDSRGI